MNERDQHRQAFAAQHGVPPGPWRDLPADASPRRYFRLPETAFGPCLLMDSPPGLGGIGAFAAIAGHLTSLGLSAPVVHARDVAQGFALIEDFGTGTYTNLLARGHDETALYELATDTLAALHDAENGAGIDLPPYDICALMDEVMLFAHWFAPAMGPQGDADAFCRDFDSLWSDALGAVAGRCETLVLRDYHVDNLMLLPDRDGVGACGLLDFQDGLIGACAYDVMSLTQDARRDLSPGLEEHLLHRYFAARPGVDRADFMQTYHLLAAQRHAKVAGIFQRLSQRDAKHQYLLHIPRILTLLERALRAAGLAELHRLLDGHLPGWTTWTPPEATRARAPANV